MMIAGTEDNCIHGKGASQPLGVITLSGEITTGRPNCPLCGRDLSATPSECRHCGIKASEWWKQQLAVDAARDIPNTD